MGPDDPLGAFQAARADVEAVLDDPALAGTEYDGQFGTTKVEDTIDRFMGFDLVVHGWDLARATGQDETIDPAEVDRTWEAAQGFGENMRKYGVTGPEVDVPAGCLEAGPAARAARAPAVISPRRRASVHERGRVVDVGGVGLEVAHGELAEGDGVGGVELLGGVEHAVRFGRPV